MVSVAEHKILKDRSLVVKFSTLGAADDDRDYTLRDLTDWPMVDGTYSNGTLRCLVLIDAGCHFDKAGSFIRQWSEDGEAAEAQGPFILNSQEFTLKGLLEYLYRRHTNGT